ncbi:hypothetical protein PR202_ga31467 [Eleusine coracana subsp. coracana]|uniref:Nucleoporin Nup54 alpha-helical domain-containing protein n=1 Tax=Eleusine coracana subsp. coracana TaxID=191504 RepID=A0AAV5DRS7_ELECO|nr:hypothetical protein PR202_ga31467 [Eleusine coracana subsp. coracana]
MEAYREDPGNPRYAFRHLLFSVTDPSQRVKPVAASDIMWAEAMRKLECMDSADRERLWPQLVQGFKDLSSRLKRLGTKEGEKDIYRMARIREQKTRDINQIKFIKDRTLCEENSGGRDRGSFEEDEEW